MPSTYYKFYKLAFLDFYTANLGVGAISVKKGILSVDDEQVYTIATEIPQQFEMFALFFAKTYVTTIKNYKPIEKIISICNDLKFDVLES
jgi:hypothetical protein